MSGAPLTSEQIYEATLTAVRNGGPGLTDLTRKAIARSLTVKLTALMRRASTEDAPGGAAMTALLLAARAVMAVRPTNWDDADDPHAGAAWTALQDALKPADPDDLGCGICALGFVQGDSCLTDVDLGPVHAACCGPERESYVGPDGEPLKDGQPIPTPWIWSDRRFAKPGSVGRSDAPLKMIDSDCIHPACGCGEGPCKATGGTTRPGDA